MRCRQAESRLNHLLDERRHWTSDQVLVAHCARCSDCRMLAETYWAVTSVSLLTDVRPFVSPDLSDRVLSELLTSANSSGESTVRTIRQPRTRWLIAASLLVATISCALLIQSRFQPRGSAHLNDGSRAVWQLQQGVVQLLGDAKPSSEYVWRSTGRGIAKLPHQVRRAAALSESTHLNAAIRPVAAAWDVLRSVLPGEAMRAEPAEGETGFLTTIPDVVCV